MTKSIYIDATHFGVEQPTGVEIYTDALLPLLAPMLQQAGAEVTWIGHSEAPTDLPPEVYWLKSPYQAFWSQRALPKLLAGKEGVFFTPSGIVPVRSSLPRCMTVHDLAVYSFPKAFSSGQRFRLTWLSAQAAKKAHCILTPSHFTKSEVEKYWSIPEKNIRVTPLGYSAWEGLGKEIPHLSSGPLIVTIGRIEEKKNLLLLLKAFAKLPLTLHASLVLAGGSGFGAESIYQAYAKLPHQIRSRVHFPGYISPAQKKWLYEHAAIVAVPGAHEGFGIPVLEGFTYKVPVVAADSGALPEIGGEAALYASASDPTRWTEAFNRLLTDGQVAEACKEKGSEKVRNYTWQATAQATADALLSML